MALDSLNIPESRLCALCGFAKNRWQHLASCLTKDKTPPSLRAAEAGDIKQEVRALLIQKTVTEIPSIKRTPPVLNEQNKRTRGRPQKWASDAERMAAKRKT